MEFLSFEGNNMGDQSLAVMCDKICDNFTIRVLNFSKNEITDLGVGKYTDVNNCTWLCKVIRKCIQLKGLFLHYNKIQGRGGYQIAKLLKKNKNIKVFDISFNSIGGGLSGVD